MTDTKNYSRTIGVLLIVIFMVVVLVFRPRVRIQVERDFERVDPRSMLSLIRNGRVEDIAAAVEASGKCIDDTSWLGHPLLVSAVIRQRHDVAEWLLSKGADPDGSDNCSITPLESAIENEDVPMIRLLIDAGADPDLDRLSIGITPRSVAAKSGNPAVIAALSDGEEPAPDASGDASDSLDQSDTVDQQGASGVR